MLTIGLAVACALLVATALTFALRSRHWRRKADAYKGLMAHHQQGAGDAVTLHELDVLSRLDDVRVLAARMQQHAEPDGLTAADVRVFAAKLRVAAMGGEQR
ncbi:hypothetical protein LY13_003855 [Prauserella aidingensis]|uniref:hypothetical protein n=1 Tax=Prauserella aidingensis TaxID=387890 RepID=UPI0020A60D36|nr:hypothetical protein [Prauserella aidingensis]MCP2255081.1 hypothetical protein [Prauserella aidingensis]